MMAVFLTTNIWVDTDLVGHPQEVTPTPKANAQATTQTTFYFKNDTATASTYYDITGPNNEESTDTAEVTEAGATTAIAQHPVFGALVPGVATDSVQASSTVDANADLVWYRTFIMPLAADTTFTSATTFQIGASFDESSGNANAMARAFVYVYDGDENPSANVKTLAGPGQDTTEIGTSNEGILISTTEMGNVVGAGTPYTTDTDDYLAVEIWVNFNNTRTTAYTCTFMWGGNTAVATGTGNASPASYITVNNTIVDTFDPLYFRETNVDHEPTNTTSIESAPEGGTLDSRRMQTGAGSSAETNSQAATASGEWLFNIFTSPPLAAQTIPASSNFIIKMCGNESNISANAFFRYAIYTWDPDDTIGDTIVGVTQVSGAANEWAVATTDNQVEIVVNNGAGAITISAGERLVIEMNEYIVNTYTVNHYFGGANTPSTSPRNSAIIPPLNSNRAPLQYQAATYTESDYQFDEDDDDETHIAWTNGNGGAIDPHTAAAFNAGVNFRLRIQIENAGGEPDVLQPKIEYQVSSPPGAWVEITTSAAPIKIIASAQFTEPTATTRQLTDQTSSGYDFVAGQMEEDSSPARDTTMGLWNFTEYEWSLVGAGSTQTYNIRANDNGSAFATYTYTPQITITGYTPEINNWRWYADEADASPDEADAYAAENTAPPQIENGKSIPYKLRVNLTETGGIAENDSRKVLKYTISLNEPIIWVPVGSIADGTRQWRFYDGGGTDGDKIPSKVLSDSHATNLGTHNEASSTGQTNSDHPASTTVEWEFCIEHYSVLNDTDTTYYFGLYDEVLAASIPLASGKSYPSLKVADAYALTISSPSSVALGNYQFGSGAYHEYDFVGGEEITVRDNRGQTSGNSTGWDCTATVTTEFNTCATGTLGNISFIGGGLNDMSHNNTYEGCSVETFTIQVANTISSPDTFGWSSDLGGSGSGDMSTDWVELQHGVAVKWAAVDGHFTGNVWQFTSVPGSQTVIADSSTYWISDVITGLFAAPTTNISTQSGDYMGSAVTAASVAGSSKDGLGGFTLLPTLRIYNIAQVGAYTGSITLTLI
jgi:hypothetical protein